MSDDAVRFETAQPLPTSRILSIAAAAGLVPLNATMIAVALPEIADDFDVSTATVSVLITIYLVVMLIGQPLAGRMTDAIGARRSMLFALTGLAIFSMGAAMATTFGVLVAARGAQAVCAATLSPAAQSLLRSTTGPDQRGRVFGILGSVMGTGAAIGPVLGGALVQAFGWQAIFIINVPIAAVAFLVTRRVRDGVQPAAGDAREDDQDGRILNRVFVAGFSVQALSTQAQYALLLLTPVILDARGWGAGSIGLALSALTVGMIVVSPIGGRLGDEHGRRLPSRVGLTVAWAATLLLLAGGGSIAPWALFAGLLVFGIGLGVTTPNLTSAALGSVPAARSGAAAGVLSMSRYVGSITTALLIAGFVTADGDGSRVVLGVATVSTLLAIVVAGWLPDREPHTEVAEPGATPERAT
ncbi:MAG: MFS transporter [Acidimicrobiia bacterium]|nr:MFS transporter [Acidimicrobiia bacterium]